MAKKLKPALGFHNLLAGRDRIAHPPPALGFQNWIKAHQFTPYAPLTADQLPPGTYDPSLDAEQRAAGRGLGYLESDIPKQQTRLSDDLQTALARIRQAQGRQTEALGTQYRNLATNQGAAARAAGVARGGALAQALAKRTANQQFAQQGIDTSAADQIAGQTTQFNRGTEDLTTQLQRGRAENAYYGTDIGAQKIFQAGQGGFEFPTQPTNEFTSPGGTVYRTTRMRGKKRWLLPSGAILNTRPA